MIRKSIGPLALVIFLLVGLGHSALVGQKTFTPMGIAKGPPSRTPQGRGRTHHLGVMKWGKGEVVVDTIQYCWDIGEYYTPLDYVGYTTVYDSVWWQFRPVAEGTLMAVEGCFHTSGRARVYVSHFVKDSCYYLFDSPGLSPNLFPMELFWNVMGNDSIWQTMDLMAYPNSFRVPLTPDTSYVVGYRTDNTGHPWINLDDAYTPMRTTREHDWRFSYGHRVVECGDEGFDCLCDFNPPDDIRTAWYYMLYYTDPFTYPYIMFRAIVMYVPPIPPFMLDMTQLMDTYQKEISFPVEARLIDIDGALTSAKLYWRIKGGATIDSVEMELSEGKTTYWTAAGHLTGNYSVGDTVEYWSYGWDSDGMRSIWNGPGPQAKCFVIREPNLQAKILLINDFGIERSEWFYTRVLDDLGYQYNYWSVLDNHGIDSSIVEAGDWNIAVIFGQGATSLPGKDYSSGSLWVPFLDAGTMQTPHCILYVDQDYFCAHQDEYGCDFDSFLGPGEFLYDYFGVKAGESNPGHEDTLFVLTDSLTAGSFYQQPLPIYPLVVEGVARTDYVEPRAEAVTLISTLFWHDTCGVRFETPTFKTAFLPLLLEAAVDPTTGEPSAAAHSLIHGILRWFGIEKQAHDSLWVESTRAYLGQRGKVIKVFGKNCSELSGYSICVKFNPDVFEVDTLTLAGTRGEGAIMSVSGRTDTTAKVGVVYVYSCPGIPPGEGPLVNLIVNINEDAPIGPSTLELVDVPPALNRFSLCEGGAVTPSLANGTLEVHREMFVRGDDDADGELTISDPILSLCYQFADCPQPSCMDACDVDDDGELTISDPIRNLCYQFADCDPPAVPFPSCGPDPTDDELDCASYLPCGTEALTKRQISKSAGKIEVGKVRVSMGGKVVVPVYLTNTQPLSGFAYTIRYDPTILRVISAQDSGLVTEGFDFFSAKINNEGGWIKVGNVVSFGMSENLPVGTHQVARVAFLLDEGQIKDDVALELADGQFADMEARLARPELVGGVIEVGTGLPKGFDLSQNYPNPFNPVTEISYQLPRRAKVTIRIYNTMGRLVKILVDEEQPAGFRTVRWNGKDGSESDVSSGVYFCRMRASGFIQTRKMVLLR